MNQVETERNTGSGADVSNSTVENDGEETIGVEGGESFVNKTGNVLEFPSVSSANISKCIATNEVLAEGLKESNDYTMGSEQTEKSEKQLEPETETSSTSSHNLSQRNPIRSVKEIMEESKKLHALTDDLHEKISNLFTKFSDTILRSVFLFDPTTVRIISDENEAIGGLPSPEEVHFTRQSVTDSYIELSQVVSQRPGSESKFLKEGFNRFY